MTRLFAAEKGDEKDSDAVRILLGHAIRMIYGSSLPEIEKEPGGKPFFPERPDICFSLSHTLRHVLVAVSDSPVGCDIEAEREVSERLQGRVCSPSEIREFDFFDSWVLKESYIKLCGSLTDELVNLSFSHNEDEIVSPEFGVSAQLFNTVEGCHIGVCVRSGELPEKVELLTL